MRISVVGGGKVGYALASQLEKEGHDIAIIDNRLSAIERANDHLDVLAIEGNGANVDTLKQADTANADILIAVTGSDEINIISCLLAKKMGVSNTIARIRNPEYVNSMALLEKDLGLSLSVNPERSCAREIVRSIHFSKSVRISTFAKGRVEIAKILVKEGNDLIDKAVSQIGSRFQGQVLICSVVRNNEIFIPNGNFVIHKGDRISVIATTRNLEMFLVRTGISEYRNFHEMMIIGGGRITYYLAAMLLPMGIHLKIIEKDANKCRQLAMRFPQANVIWGDGTDQEFLLSENIDAMDAFIALTDNDEENVIASIFAMSRNVERVVPKCNRVSLDFLLDRFDIANAVTPKISTANRIIRYVRAMSNASGSNIESLLTLNEGKIEALEFRVRKSCQFIGIPLKHLKFRKGIIIGYITHYGQVEIANGDAVVQEGDTVVVVSSIPKLRDINDVLA